MAQENCWHHYLCAKEWKAGSNPVMGKGFESSLRHNRFVLVPITTGGSLACVEASLDSIGEERFESFRVPFRERGCGANQRFVFSITLLRK